MAAHLDTWSQLGHYYRERSTLVSKTPRDVSDANSRLPCRPLHRVSRQRFALPRRVWSDAGVCPFETRLDRHDGHCVANASGAYLDLCRRLQKYRMFGSGTGIVTPTVCRV